MRRFRILLVLALFIGLVWLLAMIVDDLLHPEYWGVIGYRDPRLYLPILAAMAAFMSLVILQTWLHDCRRARMTATRQLPSVTPGGSPEHP